MVADLEHWPRLRLGPCAAAPQEPHEGRQARLHPEHVEAVELVVGGSRRQGASSLGAWRAPLRGPPRLHERRQGLPPCAPSPEAAAAGTLARGRCSPTGRRHSSRRTGRRHSSGDGAPPLTGGRCAAPSRGSWHAPAAGDPTSTASFHFPM